MRINKMKITSETSHFGEFLGRDDRNTLDTPPPSTIVGMLRLIYGEDIDKFVFGYTFKSEGRFKDDIKIYKHRHNGLSTKHKKTVTDCRYIEFHTESKLIIYTNINKDIQVNFPICIGKSGSPARIHLPIKEVNLINKKGKGFNQFTPNNIGKGVINPTTLVTNYNKDLNLYDNSIGHLRLNKEFEYDKYYDEDLEQNIFLWKYKNKEVIAYD